MNPWIPKVVVLVGIVVLMAIRAPHGNRSRSVKVATSYKTPLETGLLALAWVAFFLPLIWIASPAFSFAEYALGAGPLIAGVLCLGSAVAAGLILPARPKRERVAALEVERSNGRREGSPELEVEGA